MILLLGTGITGAFRLRPEALFAPPSAPSARCREFHGAAALDWTCDEVKSRGKKRGKAVVACPVT